jgi:hypothetical protein
MLEAARQSCPESPFIYMSTNNETRLRETKDSK